MRVSAWFQWYVCVSVMVTMLAPTTEECYILLEHTIVLESDYDEETKESITSSIESDFSMSSYICSDLLAHHTITTRQRYS